MSVKSIVKQVLALGAAVLLPLGFTQETDHNSRARRDRWEWAGLPLTSWQTKENPEFRWVRDVLKLPPDYFVQASGASIFGYTIGALPCKMRETKLFMELWEKVSAEEKPGVQIEAVRCLVEHDWRAREQIMEEAARRWRRA
ncbi:hypothetical protein [Prosthecobacter sp.]|uniref:hypothetical protein n=1 Tax=Prosthecobacter sp. TaxID=1965333 RepID=UPI00378509A5